MSEEEIINEVIKIKNHQLDVFEPKENIQVTRNYFNEKQRNALQGLLDLYNKEKEKNKELENKIDRALKELDTGEYTVYTIYGDISFRDNDWLVF